MLILFFGNLLTGPASSISATTAVLNLFLPHPWVPSLDTMFSINIPSWSLGCEVLFYLLFRGC